MFLHYDLGSMGKGGLYLYEANVDVPDPPHSDIEIRLNFQEFVNNILLKP